MNDDELEELEKVKDRFANADEAVKTARKKYKVSKAMEANIRSLYE